jgi:DnaJ-class molecular chaperone
VIDIAHSNLVATHWFIMPSTVVSSFDATETPPPDFKTFDYYECLEITRAADLQQIKSAFRRLALQCHPDRSKQPDPIRFQYICEAYDVLHNQETRAIYDLFGREGLENGVAARTGKYLKAHIIAQYRNDRAQIGERGADHIHYITFFLRAAMSAFVDVIGFPGYKYHGNVAETFRNFFGSTNVFLGIEIACCPVFSHRSN